MRFLALVLACAAFLLPALAPAILTARRMRGRRRPLRSTKADAKRAAHRYAERVTGRSLSWKAARKQMARWEREGRALAAAEESR